MKFSGITSLIGSSVGIVVRKMFGIIRYISFSSFKKLQTWPQARFARQNTKAFISSFSSWKLFLNIDVTTSLRQSI